VLTLDPFRSMGSAAELVSAFGGKAQYQQAVNDLEQQLYLPQEPA